MNHLPLIQLLYKVYWKDIHPDPRPAKLPLAVFFLEPPAGRSRKNPATVTHGGVP